MSYDYERIYNKKNVTIHYHLSALLSCKNNFSEMVKSG